MINEKEINIIMDTIDEYVCGYSIKVMKNKILKRIDQIYKEDFDVPLYSIMYDYSVISDCPKSNIIYSYNHIKPVAEYKIKELSKNENFSNIRLVKQEGVIECY